MKKLLTVVVVAGILSCTCFLDASVSAVQEPTSIAGSVSDSKGTPIPAASVRVSSGPDMLAETLTDLDGGFQFEGLPAGTYQLSIEIVGFVKATKDAVDVSADTSRNLEIHLASLPRPAPSKASAEVPRKQQPQTPMPNFSTFQAADVMDLPGLDNFQLDPGQEALDMNSITSREDSFLFVSGNSASLDAGDWNDQDFRGQMMDAARQMGMQIQEFRPGGPGGMGGPGGEMGGFGGGGGPGGPGGGMGFSGMGGMGRRGPGFQQSKIEGRASISYGNSALNARNYSLTGQTLQKPVQIQNNFSLTLGGVIPFIGSNTTAATGGQPSFPGRGRISQPGWSVTYSGNRNRSAMDVLTTVPTELERKGDFSQTYGQSWIIDPITGQQVAVTQPVRLYLDPNDPSSQFTQIPSIDGIADQLLEFIPYANLPCAENAPCVNNYALQRSLPTSSDQIRVSVTGLQLTSGNNIGVNYGMRRGSSLGAATFPGLDTNRTNSGQNISVSGTSRIQQRLIANWRVDLNRTRTESINDFAFNRNVAEEFGIKGVSPEPVNWGPPAINYTSYGNISLGAPSINQNQTFAISGGLRKIGRSHSLQAGGDINWIQSNSKGDSNGRGTYSFTGYATVLLDAQGGQVAGTGNDFADFLLGLPYSTSRRYVDSDINPYGSNTYLRNRTWNLFVMDNWRARSNLTINYGLRYEYTGPSFEKYNRLVSLDASPDFSELTQVFPDEFGSLSGEYYPRSIVNPDRNNFAPRVGLAWKPKNRWPLVIRTGYGIGYDTGGYSSIVGQLINQSPFAVNQNLATDRSNPLTLEIGFPNNPTVTIQNTYAIDPHYRPSYVQQWNLDVQSQISSLFVMDVSYSGAKGTGLNVLRAPNRWENASTFMFQTSGANSIYHGLDVQFSRRFSRGFNLRSSYTFSKSIDNVSGGGGASVAQNDLDLAAERALSSQDQRHNFQMNFMYELPIGQNRAFFSSASPTLLNFIAGWTFSGSLAIASGTPITPRYASSSGSASGAALYNSLRADGTGISVSLPREERTTQRFFNTAAFAIPSGPFGTAGRNTIPGPGSNAVNMSVRKSIRLDENNRRLDFSWQVQNLFNHPSWSGVSSTVNALNFGQVTSVRPMRSMTMDLSIRF